MENYLPHEITIIKAQLKVATAKEQLSGVGVGEAAGPECDWHDNFAYEQARRDHESAVVQRRGLAELLRDSGDGQPYPNRTSTAIAVGSLVVVRYDRGYTGPVLICNRTVPSSVYDAEWERNGLDGFDELDLVNARASVGELFLGKEAGESFQPSGKYNTFEVVSVDQTWCESHLGSLTTDSVVEVIARSEPPEVKERLGI